ncbi:major facilitator superfamily transporter [Colletotrichum graminicola M1.001]|uniref:Major facilitator superfamily transporter n=1 Tax=Colletotrichum graminicola (strain M1.001 / M2 / FGSC 10212) TaxID=645133 RepID=E3QZY0_COLGM|nr:major facilitator superfamily transporter [Colletotrichum graminicola M1.001]EFQ36418.1 major facilitator superfamily transporter [Colletotrichum graminicola M1.001]
MASQLPVRSSEETKTASSSEDHLRHDPEKQHVTESSKTQPGDEASKHVQNEANWNWDTDPYNPLNWPARQKFTQMVMISLAALTSSLGTSIISPAHTQLMEEFGVTATQAIVPLSMYVFALGLGPVVGGPLSETVGRHPVYLFSLPLGALFTLGVGFCHSFAGVCILRFLAGFCLSPSLAIGSGTINETYQPSERALPTTAFILMPFLGPGLGPVIGAFVVNRKGWRWTQWTMLFFIATAMVSTILSKETYHTVLQRRRAAQLGLPVEPLPVARERVHKFATSALARPVRMMFTEPIVSFICLYVACEFATLFSFFAALPYVFRTVYGFGIEQQGLIFLSIAVGCVLGSLTIMLCNAVIYLPQTKKHPPQRTPPEYRLYPAMVGSIGLPLGLFWFGWTAREDISWASPVVAIMPFAWGNICVFVSTMQYLLDVYKGTNVASAASANSLARYVLAGAFPLFVVQMYTNLGIGWASSLLGFIALALMPVPWAFFKFGRAIRQRSTFDTVTF